SLFDLSRQKRKKEKYKDILIALLSIVVSGKIENTAYYLRDSKEIINLYSVHKASRSLKQSDTL
ncbi:uncharacterized protein N7446_007807, partial [Penicillium canescens]